MKSKDRYQWHCVHVNHIDDRFLRQGLKSKPFKTREEALAFGDKHCTLDDRFRGCGIDTLLNYRRPIDPVERWRDFAISGWLLAGAVGTVLIGEVLRSQSLKILGTVLCLSPLVQWILNKWKRRV